MTADLAVPRIDFSDVEAFIQTLSVRELAAFVDQLRRWDPTALVTVGFGPTRARLHLFIHPAHAPTVRREVNALMRHSTPALLC